MTKKVIKVGNSAAVTLSKTALKELGLKVGDEVSVVVDKKTGTVRIAPESKLSKEDQRVAKLTAKFIERYRPALEELAKK